MRQMNMFELIDNECNNYENILNAKGIKIVDDNFMSMNYRKKKNVANFTCSPYGDMLIYTNNKINQFDCKEDGEFISISGMAIFDKSYYGFGIPVRLNNFESDLERLLKSYEIKEERVR